MKPGKTVLTTGQVAKICSVAPRTVSKWFDQGHLLGYRIPGSKDRRIPLESLVKFMRANNMPLNGLDTGRTRVLLVEGDLSYAQSLARALEQDGGYEIMTAASTFEAGVQAGGRRPDVLIVDISLPGLDTRALCRFIRASSDMQGVRIIAIGPNLDRASGEALKQDGFTAWVSKPFDVRTLISVVEAPANGTSPNNGSH